VLRHEIGFLREIADRRATTEGDPPRVGTFDSGDHLHQGRLSGAVHTDETDLLPFVDREGDFIEQDPGAETLAELLNVEDCGHVNFRWVLKAGRRLLDTISRGRRIPPRI